MEAFILWVRLGLRRAWRALLGFLDRNKLSDMPAVKTIALLLAIGLIVPLAMSIDQAPASVSRSLADQRVERLVGTQFPDVSPTEETLCPEPTFFWKGHAEAKRYRFRLFAGDSVIHATTVTTAHYVLPSPGELGPGEYRFAVEAFKEDGGTLGQLADARFSIRESDKQVAGVRADAARQLDLADAAYVMAGLYAERGATQDARSALARYVALERNADRTKLARSILGR